MQWSRFNRLIRNHKYLALIALATALLSASATAYAWNSSGTGSTVITAGDITVTSGTPTGINCSFLDASHVQVNWAASSNAGVRGYDVASEQPVNGTFGVTGSVSGVSTTSSAPQSFSNANYYNTGWAVRSAAGANWRSSYSNEVLSMACDRISHTLAGPAPTGTAATGGFSGDGGAATSATLNNPRGMYYDSTSDILYFADTGNNRVRAISPVANAGTPIIKTVAGNGTATFAGDSGTATSGSLNGPSAVAYDATNNDLYIADSLNNRIRKVHSSSGTVWSQAGTSNNVITTVAGNGAVGTGGGAGDGDTGNSAVNGQLNNPQGVYFGTTNSLWISDSGHNRIRKLTTNTLTLVTEYGDTGGASGYVNGAATATRFNNPTQLLCSASPTCYVADTGNNRVRYIPNTGASQTLGFGSNNTAGNAGDGLPWAGNTTFNGLTSVITDTSGAVIIADAGNNRIRYNSNYNQKLTYPIAGSTSGTSGSSGEGVAASTVLMSNIGGLQTNNNSGTTRVGDIMVSEGNRIRIFSRT